MESTEAMLGECYYSAAYSLDMFQRCKNRKTTYSRAMATSHLH
jgi:hypothetical protein